MKFPSAIFYAIEKVSAALTAIAWPTHPITGEKPSLALGETFTPPQNEEIRLAGRADDPAEQGFVTFGVGQSKDEMFALMVVITSAVPCKTQAEVFARLEQLVGVIETKFRSSSTGKPAGLFSSAGSTDPQCIRWEVSSVDPTVYPTVDGFGGDCRVTLAFKFRI